MHGFSSICAIYRSGTFFLFMLLIASSLQGCLPKLERRDSFEGLSIKQPLEKSPLEGLAIAKREPEEWKVGLILTRNSKEAMRYAEANRLRFHSVKDNILCRGDLVVSAFKDVLEMQFGTIEEIPDFKETYVQRFDVVAILDLYAACPDWEESAYTGNLFLLTPDRFEIGRIPLGGLPQEEGALRLFMANTEIRDIPPILASRMGGRLEVALIKFLNKMHQ